MQLIKSFTSTRGERHPLKGKMINLPKEAPTLAALIAKERERPETTLNLIAAENTASAAVLEAAEILSNRYGIPFDPETIQKTSGLRLGAPGICTRAMGADEVRFIAGWIDRILSEPADPAVQQRVRAEVQALCRSFPLRDTIGD
jgi:glycine/serine hydroxymethyltransferase